MRLFGRTPSALADSPWPKFHHDLRNTGRTDEGNWSRLRMVGQATLPIDSSGFLIRVVNEGTVEVAVNSLVFSDTSESLYMRDFQIDAEFGYGFPVPTGQPGAGPGDTVRFAPVTIEPTGSQLVELFFREFHADPLGNDMRANVHGKTFRFRFSDGSEITVYP